MPSPRYAVLSAASALLLVLPTAASAAPAAPGVTTGGASRVTPSTATLTGTVDPNTAATTYSFQIGPTTAYGFTTPATSAGSGASGVAATADVTLLTPNTKYHYRLVAKNSKGTVRGADRSFTTKRQPLGLVIGASPSPVTYGSGTTISGTLSGTGNAGRDIILRQNPFPFTSGLAPFGNRVVTNAAGSFAVALLTVPITTQYTATVADAPSVVSQVLTIPVALRVSTNVAHTRVSRRAKVRFSGTIRPARDGAQVLVQRRSNGAWKTVGRTVTKHSSTGTHSTYARRVSIRKSGSYRVFVEVQDGNYVSAEGRTLRFRFR